MSIELDFTCEVPDCGKLAKCSGNYCNGHYYLNEKYGTPTPVVPCHECGEDYLFVSGVGQKGQYRICPECVELLKKYKNNIANWTSVYGVTRVYIVKLLIKQDFKCVICERKPKENLVIDHDHKCCPASDRKAGSKSCGKCIRGLLCIRCNVLLGHYENNPTLIEKLMRYVER